MADGRLIFDTKLDTGGLQSGLYKLGSAAGSAMKGLSVGVGATATAMAALGKEAIKGYAQFEQLEGGIQKLYGNMGKSLEEYADYTGKSIGEVRDEWQSLENAQNLVAENASNAWQTVGVSTNQYIESVTGFSAALIESVGGNTELAAQKADQAMRDIADNANTFGKYTVDELTQVYQALAKGQYQTLDNLNLGFGGTKEGMQKLIDKANELAVAQGQAGNLTIDSYADIVDAIHLVQESMNIAGTTEREAASTIEGSINAAKAAWENLVTGIADDEQDFDKLVDNFVSSVVVAGDNLIPRIKTTIEGLGKLASGLIKEALPQLVSEIPPIISDLLPIAIESFQYLVEGFLSVLPEFINVVLEAIPQLVDALLNLIPVLSDTGTQIILNLINGIAQALPELISAAADIIILLSEEIGSSIPQIVAAVLEAIPQLVNVIMSAVPQLISAVIQLVTAIVEVLPTIIQALLDVLPTLIDSIINGLINGVSALIDGAITLFMAVVDAIPQIIPKIVAALPKIINSIVSGITRALPQLLEAAITLLMAIVNAIPQIIPPLVQALPEIITTIVQILVTNIPLLLDTAIMLFHAILDALPTIITALTAELPQIVNTVVDVLVDNIPVLLDAALTLFMAILQAIPTIIDELINSLPQIIDTIVTSLGQGISAVAEIGEALIRGLWNGISNMSAWISEKIRGFGKGVLDALKNFFGIHSPSKVMEKEVGKNIALGVIKGVDGEKKNVKKSAEELANLYVSAAKSRVSELKKANKLTEAQEISFWKEILSHCKKGTKAYNTASAQLTTAKNTLKKDVASLTQSYVKELAKVQENLEEDIKKIQDDLDKSIEDLENTYIDAVASRTKEIASSFNLFDEVKLDDVVEKEDLTKNLEAQVNALKDWEDVLQSLKERIGSNGLYDELQEMGVSSLDTLKSLNSMSDEELRTYIALYDEKQAIALRQSQKENELLKAQTEEQIRALQVDAQAQIDQLNANAQAQMDSLKKTYKNELKKLGVTTKKQAEDVAKAITDGMNSGLKSGSKEINKTLKSFAKSMINQVKKELDIHSPSKKFGWIGKMCLDGFEQEFEDFDPYDSMGRAMKANKGTLTMNYNAGLEAEYGNGFYDYAKNAKMTAQEMCKAGFGVYIDNRTAGRLIGRYT